MLFFVRLNYIDFYKSQYYNEEGGGGVGYEI